jgi:hypothetical protein
MIRLILALAIGMGLTSTALASLAPPREPRTKTFPPAQASKVLPAGPREAAADRGTTPEFVVTAQTEVLLDGKPCKYALVPGHASIVHLELGADSRTVVKIHFRTRK